MKIHYTICYIYIHILYLFVYISHIISHVFIQIYRFKETDNLKYFNTKRETMELGMYYQSKERHAKSGHQHGVLSFESRICPQVLPRLYIHSIDQSSWNSTMHQAYVKCQGLSGEQKSAPGTVEQKSSVDADINHTLVQEGLKGSPRPATNSSSDYMIMKLPSNDYLSLSERLLSDNCEVRG